MAKPAHCVGTVAVLLALAGCAGPKVPLPSPSPTPQAVEVSVALDHCGVAPLIYQGKAWLAGPATLFDDTSKPAAWKGHGTVTEIDPTGLLYRDDSDIEVTFRLDSEIRPPRTCA